MTDIFLTALRCTLSTMGAGISRVVLLLWLSTLQAERRHGRYF